MPPEYGCKVTVASPSYHDAFPTTADCSPTMSAKITRSPQGASCQVLSEAVRPVVGTASSCPHLRSALQAPLACPLPSPVLPLLPPVLGQHFTFPDTGLSRLFSLSQSNTRLNGLKSQIVFSCSSGGWKTQSHVSAGCGEPLSGL